MRPDSTTSSPTSSRFEVILLRVSTPVSSLRRHIGPFLITVFGGGSLLASFAFAFLALVGAIPGGIAFALMALVATGAGFGLVIVATLKRRLEVIETEVRTLRKQVMRELGTTRRGVEAIRRDVAKQVFDPYAYWEARADTHGPDGVGDLSRPLSELVEDTVEEKAGLLPFFRAQLDAPPERILDFGCGFGRFTNDLAALATETAVGVDATPALIEAAVGNASDKAEYLVARGTLPFPDNHFDAVWVAYVLIHVVGAQKAATAAELLRVLKPGGTVFLTEGVTTWRKGSAHCEFEPFEWYARNFPVGLTGYRRDDVLTAGGRFDDVVPLEPPTLASAMAQAEKDNADLHLVMVGRKPLPDERQG